MNFKNTKDKAIGALKRIGANAKGLKQSYDYQKQKAGSEAKYQSYKMVNDADKAGVQDKGNESDPLFRARTMMKNEISDQKEAQRKALKRKI